MDPQREPREKQRHGHGRPRSWIYVSVFLIVFTLGGIGLVIGSMLMFWICLGLLVVLLPVGRLIGVMEDTVSAPTDPQEPGHG
ncbi:HGxxPAAW family protein [Herbidospora cretacea]|uniref:HGxxPAAW family protein n=1 Tax=Herbidospora cretacea TaxID=28444 RepID=UPI000774B97D|nr:HGxxPAAW family protein [Herbidospora cretacea]